MKLLFDPAIEIAHSGAPSTVYEFVMNDSSPSAGAPISWRKPILVLICGTVILVFSVGIRQTFGLFMAPVSSDMG